MNKDGITITKDDNAYPVLIIDEHNKKVNPPKTMISIGIYHIACTKKFNWFQKKMIKLFFGFEVSDYE